MNIQRGKWDWQFVKKRNVIGDLSGLSKNQDAAQYSISLDFQKEESVIAGEGESNKIILLAKGRKADVCLIQEVLKTSTISHKLSVVSHAQMR